MKQGPDLNSVEREMRPGAISGEGFLGKDPRHLVERDLDPGERDLVIFRAHGSQRSRFSRYRGACRRAANANILRL